MKSRQTGTAPPFLENVVASILSCVRCIAQHEDALCELLHDLRHSGASAHLCGELLALADDLPAYDYASELDELRDMLGKAAPDPALRKQRNGAKLSTAKGPNRPVGRQTANQRATPSRVGKNGRKPSKSQAGT